MDLRRSWSCGCSDPNTIQLGRRSYNEVSEIKLRRNGRSRRQRWKVIWRRILMKGRRKIFDCCPTTTGPEVNYNYDPFSYSQNFDRGLLMWDDEPDNLSRSFSMRFADPSRLVFLRKEGTVL